MSSDGNDNVQLICCFLLQWPAFGLAVQQQQQQQNQENLYCAECAAVC